MRRGAADVLPAGGGGGGINSDSRDITGLPNSRTNTSVAIKKGTYVGKSSSDAAIREIPRVARSIEKARSTYHHDERCLDFVRSLGGIR